MLDTLQTSMLGYYSSKRYKFVYAASFASINAALCSLYIINIPFHICTHRQPLQSAHALTFLLSRRLTHTNHPELANASAMPTQLYIGIRNLASTGMRNA